MPRYSMEEDAQRKGKWDCNRSIRPGNRGTFKVLSRLIWRPDIDVNHVKECCRSGRMVRGLVKVSRTTSAKRFSLKSRPT